MIQLRYKASAEQFGPKKLLEFAVLSEEFLKLFAERVAPRLRSKVG
jgi:hypothetical protein